MESIQSFDLSLLNAIQDTFRCGFLDVFTVFLSYLTTSGIIWIVAGVVLLFFRKTRAAGIILLMALAIGYLTGDVLLKHLVNRPRPFTVNPNIVLLIKQPSGASFPSTHSTLASLPVDSFNEIAADVDGDGEVTIIDATFIQRWLANLPCPDGIGQPIT